MNDPTQTNCRAQIIITESCLTYCCPCQSSLLKTRIGKIRELKVCRTQVGAGEISFSKVSKTKIGLNEIRSFQICVAQIRVCKVSSAKDGLDSAQRAARAAEKTARWPNDERLLRFVTSWRTLTPFGAPRLHVKSVG